MSRKNLINRHLKSLQPQGKVVESLLERCMKEASILELTCNTRGVLPISYSNTKELLVLFYLREYDLIS